MLVKSVWVGWGKPRRSRRVRARAAMSGHDAADSRDDAEGIWLPVLAALQDLLDPG